MAAQSSSEYVQRLLSTLVIACDEYIAETRNLESLIVVAEATESCLDNSAPGQLKAVLRQFAGNLERIRWMSADSQQHEDAGREIAAIKRSVEIHCPPSCPNQLA
jgi:hypothetical protein